MEIICEGRGSDALFEAAFSIIRLDASSAVYLAYQAIEEQIQKRREDTEAREEEGAVSAQPKRTRVIYLSPQGQTFSQEMAQELAEEEDLVLLCGHYEGIDERVLEEIVTDYVSIGDYVLTGGELPAMVMVDTISRLVPRAQSNILSKYRRNSSSNSPFGDCPLINRRIFFSSRGTSATPSRGASCFPT